MTHFKRWGAVWILALMFLGSWLGQLLTQIAEVRDQAGPFLWHEFWPQFWAATFENWQSEFFQLAFQAVLIASYVGQKKFFNADGGADKDDVDKILVAVGELRRDLRSGGGGVVGGGGARREAQRDGDDLTGTGR